MRFESILRLTRPLLVVAGFGLFLDLFLNWREVTIQAGPVAIEAGSSAWSNASGLAAGIVVSVLVILELPLLATGNRTVSPARAAFVAGLGTVVLGLTIAAFAETSVDVTTPMAAVEVSGHLWPAYAGLFLASVIALTSLVQLAGSAGSEWRPAGGVAHPLH